STSVGPPPAPPRGDPFQAAIWSTGSGHRTNARSAAATSPPRRLPVRLVCNAYTHCVQLRTRGRLPQETAANRPGKGRPCTGWPPPLVVRPDAHLLVVADGARVVLGHQ